MTKMDQLQAYRYRLAIATQDWEEALQAYKAAVPHCRTALDVMVAYRKVQEAFDATQVIAAEARAAGLI